MRIKKIFNFILELQNRYIPALLFIALFSAFSYINMIYAINSLQKDGEIINRSGIQRMLSQNLVLKSLNYLTDQSTQNQILLQNNIDYFLKSHNELMKIEQNNAIKKIYYQDGLLEMLDELAGELKLFSTTPSYELLLSISAKSQSALPLLSDVVKEYELENLSKVNKLKQRQLSIFAITVILLVLMLAFIFYPAGTKIKNNQDELEKKVKDEVEKNRVKDAKLAQQARSAQMGEMIDMIAHQWRQPLNSISLINSKLELGAMMGDGLKDIEQHTKYIATLIGYLNHTIDDFRNFYRAEKQKSLIECDKIIDSVFVLIHPLLQKHNIAFHKEILCEKKVYTYKNELKQVLLTIVANAIYALDKNGVKNPFIKVKCFSEDEHLNITISDNGGGIDEQIISKIFDANFTTKGSEGSGVGLYLSRTIIEDHCDGKITVSNSDEGAVFNIRIKLG
ncbi:MAG: ATP-binding protein [Sulfurimonas sp.]|jgi:signal transduction histidine kinase|nr:ATP-binding protein [Sulfurimonadaceae bacterium]